MSAGELVAFSEARRGRAVAVSVRADVVIVGSGAAGAVAAKVLTDMGLEVVVVEEGSPIPLEARKADLWGAFRQCWREAGFQVARGRSMLPVLQGRAVGGSTVVYGAIVHRIPEPILETWVREHGIGDALPLDELTRIYDQLDRDLSVAPAPTEVEGRNNQLMAEAARAMGIRSNAIRRNVVACQGSCRCLQGCPTGRKQSLDLTYLPQAMEKGLRIYADCRVERITRAGGRATGVRGRFIDPETGRPGGLLEVSARHVVLAASAIQTPILLRRNGIGGRSGQVGRRLQGHPGAGLLGVFDDPVRIWFGATQGHETTHWWGERMKMETVGMPLDGGAARLPGVGAPLMKRVAEWGHIAQWGAQVRAEAHGTVRPGLLSEASIAYSWSPRDIATLKVGLVRVAEMMFAAGARSIYPGIHGLPEEARSMDEMKRLTSLPDDPRLFHGIMSHMFGTAVMGPDPERSVVDCNGEVHGLQGLSVFDSSIFPTNMGVNPAHTISAISWLLAERLGERLRG